MRSFHLSSFICFSKTNKVLNPSHLLAFIYTIFVYCVLLSIPKLLVFFLVSFQRGGEKAWESLYENVLDPNDADLALIGIGKLPPAYMNASLLTRAKYVWDVPEFDDWADAIDLVNGTEWRKTHLPLFHKTTTASILFGGIKGFRGSAIIGFMIRWYLSQRLVDDSILEKYDTFALTRADHYYLCPHIFTNCDLKDNTMWIPEGEDWRGYCDRHLVVSKDNILDSLDVIPQLIQKPYTFDPLYHANSESFYKHVWTDQKNLHVKRSHRVMFATATSFDETRGREPGREIPGVKGLMIKYETEFEVSQNRCDQYKELKWDVKDLQQGTCMTEKDLPLYI